MSVLGANKESSGNPNLHAKVIRNFMGGTDHFIAFLNMSQKSRAEAARTKNPRTFSIHEISWPPNKGSQEKYYKSVHFHSGYLLKYVFLK